MKIKMTIKTILTLIIILLITANFNIVQANIQVASGVVEVDKLAEEKYNHRRCYRRS